MAGGKGDDDLNQIDYAAMDDLLKLLRFSPKDGQIWLADQRMVLMHLSTLTAMRRHLVDAYGVAPIRALFTHMGYISGTQDAEIARRVRAQESSLNRLLAGPLMYALEGVTLVNPITVDMDVEQGRFFCDLCWENSSEVQAHVSAYGISADPVCWMQVGHASGYSSGFMGRQVIYREIECQGMGASHCRIVGRTREEWGDQALDLPFLQMGLAAEPKVPSVALRKPPPAAMGNLVGVSTGFVTVCHMLEKVARTSATVLLLGETGVGKEMFAKALHRISPRAKGNFVAVNCAAIPETLIESELFGVEKGAYTGAAVSRPGRFERANDGTLFLDEVGILSFPAQGKLLRALQEHEIERVGDTQVRPVNVRVVAATNESLEAAVKAGRFREDLWFRLNVFPIRIPPLRERRDDVSPLMEHFLKKFNAMHDRRVSGFTARAVDAMLTYGYPGNIRELENMIERAMILADDDSAIDLTHLFSHAQKYLSEFLRIDRHGVMSCGSRTDSLLDPIAEQIVSLGVSLEDLELLAVRKAMDKCNGNLSRAGRMLGMSRSQMTYRLKTGQKNGPSHQ